jgi:hypothetical protein
MVRFANFHYPSIQPNPHLDKRFSFPEIFIPEIFIPVFIKFDFPFLLRYKVACFLKGVTIMYIDPNTGGVLFQALAASLAAISGVLLIFSRQIRQAIAKLRRGARKDEDESTKE